MPKFNLPGVHGGISQQSPNLRLANQHTSADNVLFDLLAGIRGPRWGTSTTHTFGPRRIIGSIKTTDGKVWFISWNKTTGALAVHDVFNDDSETPTGATTYLSGADPEDLVVLPILDTAIIVNKKKPVASKLLTDSPTPATLGVIYIPQVYEGLSWDINISCTDGDGASLWSDSVSGTIGTGETPDDLRVAIQAGLTPPAGFSIIGVGNNMIYFAMNSTIVAQSPTLNIVSNSEFEIRCYSAKVAPVNPLAPTAINIVTMTSSYENLPPAPYQQIYFEVEEGYYVRFDGASYVECPCPGHSEVIDKSTMPHELRWDAVGGWTFADVDDYDDLGRLVGDSNSAPLPDFVGRTLNYAFYYRNRLCFLSDNYVAMSKTGGYYDWFPETATEVVDSDPIVVFPAHAKYSELLWAIPFSKQLVLISDTKQYVLHSGYEALTPQTVAIDEATSYTLVPSVEPLLLPASMMLPLDHNPYLGVLEYKLDDQQIASEGSLLSSTVPKYIPHDISGMVYVPSEHMVLLYKRTTDDVWVYKFNKREDGSLTQMAWSHWTLPGNIEYVYVHEGSMVVFMLTTGVILYMNTSTTWDTPVLDLMQAQDNVKHGDALPVLTGMIAIDRDTLKEYPLTYTSGISATIDTYENPDPVDIWVGYPIEWSVELSPLILRDDNGLPRADVSATIENMQLDWMGGQFDVTIGGQGLPSRTKTIVPVVTTDVAVEPGASHEEPTPTRVLVMAPAKRAVVTISGDSYMSTQVNNISYNLDISRDWG